MSFQVEGSTLTVTLNNTSSTRLDSNPDAGNAPGISGFGFNLDPDILALQSWTLEAWDKTTTDFVTIGSNTNASLDWMMGTFLAGTTLDYLPNNGGNANGMLFNPDALTDSVAEALLPGSGDVFFTTAILVMTFDQTPSLNDTAEFSPFVRMQNVGLGGEGSLKLPGTPGNGGGGGPGGDPIPEPHTILLMGIGLLGFGATRLRGKANA
ncbi:MAG: PEP-CTERM sorting domain-containing protein [Methylomicrobium sp.]|nr:PEP-CTERM sorting domain-containing protein [Methylomicrobium sp.]